MSTIDGFHLFHQRHVLSHVDGHIDDVNTSLGHRRVEQGPELARIVEPVPVRAKAIRICDEVRVLEVKAIPAMAICQQFQPDHAKPTVIEDNDD